MALIIIKANGIEVVDPKYFQKYDVVEVLEDDTDPGKCVCLPDFLVVKMEGKKADFLYLKKPLYEKRDVVKEGEKDTALPVLLAIRVNSFNFDTKLDAKTLEEITKSEELLIPDVQASAIDLKAIAASAITEELIP